MWGLFLLSQIIGFIVHSLGLDNAKNIRSCFQQVVGPERPLHLLKLSHPYTTSPPQIVILTLPVSSCPMKGELDALEWK